MENVVPAKAWQKKRFYENSWDGSNNKSASSASPNVLHLIPFLFLARTNESQTMCGAGAMMNEPPAPAHSLIALTGHRRILCSDSSNPNCNGMSTLQSPTRHSIGKGLVRGTFLWTIKVRREMPSHISWERGSRKGVGKRRVRRLTSE